MKDKPNMFYGANPKLFGFAKQLRAKETEAEKILWDYLNKKQFLGIRFRRQHPILYFVADFYCHKVNLIIEVDGGIHLLPEQFEYDQNRDKELEELGLRVMRFKNEEVFNDIDTVITKIKEAIFLFSNRLI
jgi:cyclase